MSQGSASKQSPNHDPHSSQPSSEQGTGVEMKKKKKRNKKKPDSAGAKQAKESETQDKIDVTDAKKDDFLHGDSDKREEEKAGDE